MINEHRNSLEKVYDAKQQKGLYAPSIIIRTKALVLFVLAQIGSLETAFEQQAFFYFINRYLVGT